MAEIAAFTKEERSAYESSLKHLRDVNNVIATARKEGKAAGRMEGIAEGMSKGRVEQMLQFDEAKISLKRAEE